jgi:hypothetical protein
MHNASAPAVATYLGWFIGRFVPKDKEQKNACIYKYNREKTPGESGVH